MSKMNPPIRWGKAITGSKTVRPILGNESYQVTTNVAGTEAAITDKAKAVVAVVGADNLTALKKRVAEALAALGVRTPIITAKAVPATTEVQLVSFTAVPDAGEFELSHGDSVTIEHDATAVDVQAALRTIEGLEQITVSGDFTAGFTVTFVGVPGNVPMLGVPSNTLTESSNPVVVDVTEVTPGE